MRNKDLNFFRDPFSYLDIETRLKMRTLNKGFCSIFTNQQIFDFELIKKSKSHRNNGLDIFSFDSNHNSMKELKSLYQKLQVKYHPNNINKFPTNNAIAASERRIFEILCTLRNEYFQIDESKVRDYVNDYQKWLMLTHAKIVFHVVRNETRQDLQHQSKDRVCLFSVDPHATFFYDIKNIALPSLSKNCKLMVFVFTKDDFNGQNYIHQSRSTDRRGILQNFIYTVNLKHLICHFDITSKKYALNLERHKILDLAITQDLQKNLKDFIGFYTKGLIEQREKVEPSPLMRQ